MSAEVTLYAINNAVSCEQQPSPVDRYSSQAQWQVGPTGWSRKLWIGVTRRHSCGQDKWDAGERFFNRVFAVANDWSDEQWRMRSFDWAMAPGRTVLGDLDKKFIW